jgi:ABC-type polysaccharide/polyol phosphate export permease/Flp pilus assembly protein TadD
LTDSDEASGPDRAARARDALAAADAHPRDVALRLIAAEAFFHAGEIAQALELAHHAATLDPAHGRAARVLSGLLAAAGDTDAAIAAGATAVQLDPAASEWRLHLGGLLVQQRRWRDAAAHLAVHVESPNPTVAGWRLLAYVLSQGGEDARATDAARQAVAAEPHAVEHRLSLASLLTARGLFADAEEEINRVLDIEPDHAAAWRTLSGILAARDRMHEALDAAERAVALEPHQAEYRTHLGYLQRYCQLPGDPLVQGQPERWMLTPRNRRRVPAAEPPGFWQDAGTRWRVIHAVIRRDIRTRFGHTSLGYAWAILEPIGHLMTLGVMFYAINHAPSPLGTNLFLYYITGLVPFLMFSHVSHDVMGAAEAGNAMLQLPIVRRTDLIVAHALRQLATELIVGIVIFGGAALLGLQGMPADPPAAAAGVLLLCLLGLGIGAVNVVLSSFFPSYETFYAALVRLLYFGSGIYYSPITMPDIVRDWLQWNPVLQGIDLFRSGFFSQYQPHWLNIRYLLAWVIGSIGIGFAAERALRDRLRIAA